MDVYYKWLFFLTGFADEAVIIPLSIVMACLLFGLGWRRGAYAWLISVTATLAMIVLLKYVFYVLSGLVDFGIDLRSPSAHTAAGALVYGSMIALILRGHAAGRKTIIAISLLGAVFFGITRLLVFAHTMAEVVIGTVLGVTGALLFARLSGRMPSDFARLPLALAAVVTISIFHGHHWKAENFIRTGADSIRISIDHRLGH